jgi:hypothetical protein
MRASACLAMGLILAAVCGCGETAVYQSHARAAILMRLASGEIDQISSKRERLTRLLNLAALQDDQKDFAGARDTLKKAAAVAAASSAGDLDTQLHVSAWVSISELSRRADDLAAARAACLAGMEFLRAVQPPRGRLAYLRGLAAEFRLASGLKASAAVLREGAKWAADVPEGERRRSVITVIAHDLFLCDDYYGGRDALRVESDANWRADTLIQLTNEAIPAPVQTHLAALDKDVTFKRNFAAQSASQEVSPHKD